MKSSVTFVGDDFIVVPKQTAFAFVLTEACVYVSQVVMFFFVAVLTSNLLRDETRLVEYMTSKINENTVYEILATMLAIAATLGIISAISTAAQKSSLLEHLAEEVLAEAPRTAYTFGSSVMGMFLAAALFLHNHPGSSTKPMSVWLLFGSMIGLVGFLYGCAFAYAFKHKARIKSADGQKKIERGAPEGQPST
ncbi:hypothetical protein ACQUJO_10610 [Ralstonia pseudosolanacearum]